MARSAIVVGAGQMGKEWARTLAKESVEIVAWVDLNKDTVRAACAELQIDVPVFDDLDEALRGPCDFVVDVTVPEAHPHVTVQALRAGLPVLGEKPMAPSMREARTMVKASEESGMLYMVSQSRRYNSGLRAFRQAVAEIGQLGILDADFYLGPHFGGFRDQMASPLLLDMAIHTFDAARYLSGRNAVSAYAEEFNPSWSWYHGDACATAVFEMEGGVRFTYRGSWCAEGLQTSWESDWRGVGAKGSARWDGAAAPEVEVVTGTEGFLRPTERSKVPVEPIAEGITGSLREFLHALDSGATPNGECHDNIHSLAMVLGAVESARLGRRVAIAR